MRHTRRLILLLIAVILSAVGVTYHVQKGLQARNAPALPRALPDHLAAKAEDWHWEHIVAGRAVVEIRAKEFQHNSESSRYELGDVELKILHKDGKAHDLVRSARAEYDIQEGSLYSEGEVEITMGVPAERSRKPSGRLLVIRSSGVRFEKSGKASTDRPASFTFDHGTGQAVGADYDPATREIRMHNDVVLNWGDGAGEDSRSMQVQAGTLVYKEADSKVFLSPWSKFQRGSLTLNAADSVVTLNDGAIQLVEAKDARGTDQYPARSIEYAAGQLWIHFDSGQEVKAITGEPNARLVSASSTASTTVSSNRVDMEFEAAEAGSVLRKATATGRSIIESKPLPNPPALLPETRILRSEVVVLNMKPRGEEIQNIETHSPGEIEFLPNRPGQKHRVLNGERMWIKYGGENRIESFRAVAVSTRTHNEQPKGTSPEPPSLTWSKDLAAGFEPKTGQLTKLEQWNDFRYEQGDRKATAGRALLEPARDVVTLNGSARMWDPTGSTSADKIILNQKTGDLEAVGNVSSTHLPDRKRKSAPALLSGEEPIQAKAERMLAADDRRRIEYQGNALLWQGANRLQAHRIEINRELGTLEARQDVFSQFLDNSPKGKRPLFTTVRAAGLTYSEKEQIAHYRGEAVLNRPGLQVNAQEIRAFFAGKDADAGSGSNLEKAIADGEVKIVQTAPDRTRTGTSEHAEYYAADGRIVLQEGQPQLVDSVRGTAKGKQLTYFSNDDRLLIDGSQSQPASSTIHRR